VGAADVQQWEQYTSSRRAAVGVVDEQQTSSSGSSR